MSTLGRRRSTTETATEGKPVDQDESAEKPVSRGSHRISGSEKKGNTRGCGAYKTLRTSSADERMLNLSEGERIIKFVDEAPFSTYLQHFLNELPQGVKKSYVSARDVDSDQDDCDICAEGDVPTSYSLFNVIDLGPLVEQEDEYIYKPLLRAWRTSPTVTDKIQRIAESRRTNPINREDLYFAITAVEKQIGKNKSVVVEKIEAIKADDLGTDTGIPVLATANFEKLAAKAYEEKEEVGVKENSDEEIAAALEKLPATD